MGLCKGKKESLWIRETCFSIDADISFQRFRKWTGAVAADSENDDFGTAYGIPDYAILTPKYSMTLNEEMTAYTALLR